MLRSGWYLLGEETAAFESEFAEYLGVDHAVGVANGTDALRLAFTALRGGAPAGELVAAANAGGYGALAARLCGMQVRFADVEDNNLLMSASTLERALTPQTSIVLVTHLYGKMAPIAAICELCHARGIAVVEDCAQAAGAHVNGLYAGSFGDAAAFSFYPTKNLGALGDGGAVVTTSDELAARVRRLRQYGWGVKYRLEEDGGQNSRLDEIQAAVLRTRSPGSTRPIDVAARSRGATARHSHRAACGWRKAVVRIMWRTWLWSRTPAARGLSRRACANAALRAPSTIRLPDHRQKFIGSPGVALPTTEVAAGAGSQSLPCFPELEDDEVRPVCAALDEVAESL